MTWTQRLTSVLKIVASWLLNNTSLYDKAAHAVVPCSMLAHLWPHQASIQGKGACAEAHTVW